jgi:hypothetical protein
MRSPVGISGLQAGEDVNAILLGNCKLPLLSDPRVSYVFDLRLGSGHGSMPSSSSNTLAQCRHHDVRRIIYDN